MTPEQQDNTKKQQEINKKRFLLSTKMGDLRKLSAEIEQLQNEIFTDMNNGDKNES